MIYAEQSLDFETPYESGVTGLVGTVEVQVVDNQGAIVIAPTTAGIIETPAGSGVYVATLLAPADIGQYTIVWSLDGTFDPETNSIDGLIVYEAGADPTLPPLPPPTGSDSLSDGPCSAWTTDDEVIACCSADIGSGDLEALEFAISQSSAILYRLSGRRYAGTCEKTVRPCSSRGCGGFQVLSRGHIVWPEGSGWTGTGWSWPSHAGCGCAPLDRIKLDGYPVRAIVQVKIDGDIILPANNWRLDKDRYLTRLADVDGDPQYWPSCQRMDITSDNEIGTFSVRYSWGQDPPWDGMAAASQLACEIYKACSSNGSGGDCALPSGVRRITRSGVTIDFLATLAWFRSTVDGKGFKTGLSLVDAFLNSVNPAGLTRRPVIVTPGKREYPMELG